MNEPVSLKNSRPVTAKSVQFEEPEAGEAGGKQQDLLDKIA